MAGAVLSPQDRADFLKLMRRQMNSAVHRRINVLLLLDDGWPVVRICEALFLDEGTVHNHRRLYEEEGRSGIERLAYGGAASPLRRDQTAALCAWIDETVPQTARQACAFVEGRFGLNYTPNALSKVMKRLGFVHKKPKNVPAKADEAVQRCFVAEVLRPLMAQAGPDRPLYFADATHPSYTGRPAHGWIRRGRTVELKSNHGRTRLNINGALCWPERSLVHRQEELITSAAQIRLFEDLAARHPQASAITVVLDNAKYNVSREIKDYLARPDCRIRLLYLPSYAPNLNLIERFWHFMKRKVLFNKAYEKFTLFKQAFSDFLQNLDAHARDLKRLITDRCHFIGKAKTGTPPA